VSCGFVERAVVGDAWLLVLGTRAQKPAVPLFAKEQAGGSTAETATRPTVRAPLAAKAPTGRAAAGFGFAGCSSP